MAIYDFIAQGPQQFRPIQAVRQAQAQEGQLESQRLQNEVLRRQLAPKPVSAKDQLSELSALTDEAYARLTRISRMPEEQRADAWRAQASQLNNIAQRAGIPELLPAEYSPETLQREYEEAAFGKSAFTDTGKALAEADRLEATGDIEAAEALRSSTLSALQNDFTGTTEDFIDTRTGERTRLTYTKDGRHYRVGLDGTRIPVDPQFLQKAPGRAETAGPGGFDVSASEAKELRGAETSTRQLYGLVDRIRQQVSQGGPQVIGAAGAFAQALDGLSAQVIGVTRNLGGTEISGGKAVPVGALKNPDRYAQTFSEMGLVGPESAALRSNITELAYARARSREPGGRLTDRDVRLSIEGLEGTLASPDKMLRVLDEIEIQASNNYTALMQTYGQPIKEELVRTPQAAPEAAAPEAAAREEALWQELGITQ